MRAPARKTATPVRRPPEDEAPRGKPARGGMSPALLVGGGLGALAIVTAGVVTVILATRSPTEQTQQLPGPQALVLDVNAAKDALKQKDLPKEQPKTTEQGPASGQPKTPPAELPKQPVTELPKQPVTEQPKQPAVEKPKEPAVEKPKEPTPQPQPDRVVNPGNGQLDRATLQKIKDATVYFRVTQPDGSIAQGSGFFGLAPGLVLTNAHVLGMLSAEGRRPKRVEVVYHSGLPD